MKAFFKWLREKDPSGNETELDISEEIERTKDAIEERKIEIVRYRAQLLQTVGSWEATSC